MSNNYDTTIQTYAQNYCTPDQKLISFISDQYNLLQEILGGTTFQSGSYGRGTAIKPVNDLDVIWTLPVNIRKSIDVTKLEISTILQDVAKELTKNYQIKNKNVRVSAQSHSVLIEFPDREDDFSIDVVPAIELQEMNEFNLPFYSIPEIGVIKRYLRKSFYETREGNIGWIKTDPKGYLNQTSEIYKKYPYYKDCVKILKTWKRNWKKKLEKKVDMKLKSFHIEQIAYQILKTKEINNSLDLLISVFNLISNFMNKPQIKDRAQETESIRYIDEYINDLSEDQKNSVIFAKDCAISLYQLLNDDDFDVSDFLKRLLSPEEMLSTYGFNFSNAIQDKGQFVIDGQVLPKDGFISGSLRNTPLLKKGLTKGINSRSIRFEATNKTGKSGIEYWKVRNTGREAFEEDCRRGEITKLSTLQNPEKTAYAGCHFVTCYLVDETNKKVIAYDTIPVKIN